MVKGLPGPVKQGVGSSEQVKLWGCVWHRNEVFNESPQWRYPQQPGRYASVSGSVNGSARFISRAANQYGRGVKILAWTSANTFV